MQFHARSQIYFTPGFISNMVCKKYQQIHADLFHVQIISSIDLIYFTRRLQKLMQFRLWIFLAPAYISCTEVPAITIYGNGLREQFMGTVSWNGLREQFTETVYGMVY